jgi:Ca2+-binding EF-hand superfamily protein
MHPRVRTREKKEETVYNDFVTCISQKAKGSAFVSENDFIQYYADINACMPAEKDEYFVDLVLKTWGLNSDKVMIAPARIAEIENIIFEKVRQRTHGADDEGKTIRKIFKHFDLDGYGTIEPNEFRKVLETLGCTFKDHEIDAVFRKYDANNNGKLDYEEFASFFARKGSGHNPNVTPVFSATREPPFQVLEKIKAKLLERGTHGIRELGNVFRRMDNSKNKKLERNELMWGLKENGHNLSSSEYERVFKYFDKNNDGWVDYVEFLRGLRGDMNDRRRGLVQMAFKKLDRTGDGLVTLEDLE